MSKNHFFSVISLSLMIILILGELKYILSDTIDISNKNIIKANNPNIIYEGRVKKLTNGDVCFDWPGVKIKFKFLGKSCSILLKDGGNDYNVYVDNMKKVLYTIPEKYLYKIAENLKFGEHEVCISKRTEGNFWSGLV